MMTIALAACHGVSCSKNADVLFFMIFGSTASGTEFLCRVGVGILSVVAAWLALVLKAYHALTVVGRRIGCQVATD